MGHQGTATHRSTRSRGFDGPDGLDAHTAVSVAATLQALASPTRLRLLVALQDGPRTVGDLVQALGVEQSTLSHQLRNLRDLGFVVPRREGRQVFYSLYDTHVTELIDQALAHAEHVSLGLQDG